MYLDIFYCEVIIMLVLDVEYVPEDLRSIESLTSVLQEFEIGDPRTIYMQGDVSYPAGKISYSAVIIMRRFHENDIGQHLRNISKNGGTYVVEYKKGKCVIFTGMGGNSAMPPTSFSSIMSNRLLRMEQKIERLESNNWHNNMGEMLVCRKYENQQYQSNI